MRQNLHPFSPSANLFSQPTGGSRYLFSPPRILVWIKHKASESIKTNHKSGNFILVWKPKVFYWISFLKFIFQRWLPSIEQKKRQRIKLDFIPVFFPIGDSIAWWQPMVTSHSGESEDHLNIIFFCFGKYYYCRIEKPPCVKLKIFVKVFHKIVTPRPPFVNYLFFGVKNYFFFKKK